MKILINATILAKQNTGLGNYTYKILEYICPLLEKNNYDIDILCKAKNYLPISCQKFYKEVIFKNFLERNIIVNKISKEPYDIVWSTTQHGSLSTKNKQIITIHDLTPLLFPKGRLHQYIYYKFLLPKLIKKCKYIITVSNNTKNDILKFYKNIDSKKIKIIYESLYSQKEKKNINNAENKILNKYNLNKQNYFCIIGIHYFYKNIHAIINTYKKYNNLHNYKILIIGNKNNKYGKYLEKLVNKNNLDEIFKFVGFISNEDKECLIDNCISLLYPTKYEGFGLPVLEAMDRNIPIICSNASSLPEVGGDAALYFNPEDIDDIYDKMMKIIRSDKLRNELINKGKENLKRFDWNIFAEEIFDIIDEVVNNI